MTVLATYYYYYVLLHSTLNVTSDPDSLVGDIIRYDIDPDMEIIFDPYNTQKTYNLGEYEMIVSEKEKEEDQVILLFH